MKKALLNLPLLCALAFTLLSCAPTNSTKPAHADNARAKTSCPGDLFTEAEGRGRDQNEASDNAKTAIGKKIISLVESQSKSEKRKEKNSEGKITISNSFSDSSQIKSSFTLYGFKEVEPPKQLEDTLYIYRGYVCNSDAARTYLDSLRIYKESLETIKRRKIDKNAFDRAVEIKNNMIGFESILEVLKQMNTSLQKEYDEIYADIKNEYFLEANKKLHWKPEKQTAYSNITFSKLSERIQMEESSCPKKSRDFVLVFSEVEKCGSNSLEIECSLKPSLAIQSCAGEKYSILTTKETITGSNGYSKGKAKENLIENLSKAGFFKEWEKEIKEVMPECSK